jgi:hypothetical protein
VLLRGGSALKVFMTRVTAHLDLNRNELEWLSGYAAKHDLSLHAAARHAIRVLNLIEALPGAWEAIEALRAKLIGVQLAAPAQVLAAEQQQEGAQHAGLVDLLEKLSAIPALSEELKAARRDLAPVLYPNGGREFERMLQGEAPLRADMPVAAIPEELRFFGPDATRPEGFERLSGGAPEDTRLNLDTSLER